SMDGNKTAFAMFFGTNTFANRKDPAKLELLYRNTALFNLYGSYVGIRAMKSTSVTEKQLIQSSVVVAAVNAAENVVKNQGPGGGGQPSAGLAVTAANLKAEAVVATYATRSPSQKRLQELAKEVTNRERTLETSTPQNAPKAKEALETASRDLIEAQAADRRYQTALKMSKSVNEAAQKAQSSGGASANAASVLAALPKTFDKEVIWRSTAVLDCTTPIISQRLSSSDRYYIGRDITQDTSRVFISNGVGLRGLAAGEEDKVSTTGLGTIYLGFGMDGPLYRFASVG